MGRKLIVAGVAAALAAVGVGANLLNDGSSTSTPSAPAAVVAPLDASQGPNVDLPASGLDQPTAAPSVTGPNADPPRDLWGLGANR
jgi:hypothetical protein